MAISHTVTAAGPGVDGASPPYVPEVPVFVSNAEGTITIEFGANGNSAEVKYAIQARYIPGAEEEIAYVQADGSLDAGEVFQTLSEWGATVTVSVGDFVYYEFAVCAQNEDASTTTAYSSDSERMNCVPSAGLDAGIEQRTPVLREITSANVRIDPDVGVTIDADSPTVEEVTTTDYYGTVLFGYVAQSVDSQDVTVKGWFSEDGGAHFTEATHATTGGDGTTGINTSPEGVSHVFAWDSEADAGNSEYQTDVVFAISAQDSTGAWSDMVECEEFTLRNLPGELAFANADSSAWGSDTTPVFEAVMPNLRGGSVGFPAITLYNVTGGSTVVSGYPKKSVESQTGWSYSEDEGETWIGMDLDGIPSDATHVRYTVQTALTAGIEYSAKGQMYEVTDKG